MSKDSNRFDFTSKFIRDPLYGFIGLSETETKIINTKVFRRLHNIKQLSHAYLVYPTAVHTRYEHSLGVTYLADKVSDQLKINDEQKEIIRLAGLLHDVGHGPFSHLFESVLKDVNGDIEHDKISMMFIREDSQITDILGSDKAEKIVQLLNHKPVDGWSKGDSQLSTDIISGTLDVDKMDYLRRDSYHIGVKYGEFDLHRLIHTLTDTNDSREKRICVKSKGMDAIENYRLGRYFMHAQVYQHHTRLIADQMFLRALRLAIHKDGIIKKDQLVVDMDLQKSHDEFLKFYISLDDRSLYDIITKCDKSESSAILNKIKDRNLLKRIWRIRPENIQNTIERYILDDEDKLERIAKEIAEKAGVKEHEIIAYRAKIPIKHKGEILVMVGDTPMNLSELSPIQIEDSRNILYIFGNKDSKSITDEHMFEKHGVKSDLIV